MRSEIHFVALDIDGTLLDSKGNLSEANKRAVDDAVDRGVEVALVTGRRFSMAEPIARWFERDLTVVANNGAIIKTSRSHRQTYKNLLPIAAARQVLAATRAFRSSCVAHAEELDYGQLVCEEIDPGNLSLQWYLNKSKEVVRRVESLETFLTVDPIQLMFGGRIATMNGVLEAIAPLAAAGRVRVTKTEYVSRDLSIVDVLSPACGKAVAIEFLLARNGWTRGNLMAIGDNHNDHDMLELAGVAVVMGQSVDAIKTNNRHVTATNDEDGVAHAIQKFILEKPAPSPRSAA